MISDSIDEGLAYGNLWYYVEQYTYNFKKKKVYEKIESKFALSMFNIDAHIKLH
jgi:hypothetical protein